MDILPVTEEHQLALGEALAEAVRLLYQDQVIAIPTDTVYGLAADPRARPAVEAIYRIKGRSQDQPLILLGASLAQFGLYIAPLDPRVRDLAQRYWPGALTLVVPRGAAGQFASEGDTIGIRVPAHPIARQLFHRFGGPLATTSANRSGETAAGNAAAVALALKDTELALVLDGGAVQEGRPSTILDATAWPPRVLRQGALTIPDLLPPPPPDPSP